MTLRAALADRLLRKLWVATRTHIATAIEPGMGGIALLGDSITHLGKWDLLLPGVPCRNLGIGGERTGHLLQRIEPLVAMQPSKVFILIGTNDLGVGIGVDTAAGNMESLLSRLRAELPACRIYLQGVMPRQRKFAARVKALNERYRAIAAEQGAVWLDLFPVFDDGDGQMRADFTEDGLHLNGAGYLAWRDRIRDAVLQ